ncbi:hypothetical protein N7492_006271 [Penicillium capsulatum]|uniref:Uncharacterized protein n=1 Tax=Penicillium capsulatum TaxID=69766 RepID=A0A9W9I142_9EURO|nr:hypothetical protein N7492_006271 [Penicillium capsulatum]KAJ6108922.1 hypothetical protein N7512_008759 [Penicillium capsulatum]
MLFTLAYLTLVGAAIWPASAGPFSVHNQNVILQARSPSGSSSPSDCSCSASLSTAYSSTGLPVSRASLTSSSSAGPSSTVSSRGSRSAVSPSTTTRAAATPTQSIIIAIIGEDEWAGNGKTKWLTYFSPDGKTPDWCNGANATKKIGHDDPVTQPPSIDYNVDSGDVFLNGCKYDSSAHTFTCDNWNATCTVVTTTDSEGVASNGKNVKTCDSLPVKELVVCRQDSGSPALPTIATGTRRATSSSSSQTRVTEPQHTGACIQGMRNASLWNSSNMDQFLEDE